VLNTHNLFLNFFLAGKTFLQLLFGASLSARDISCSSMLKISIFHFSSKISDFLAHICVTLTLGCISSPLLFSFKPTFFTGEVSLENNFCKVWCWSDQIWLLHTVSFCRVQHHFFMFFLPLESAVFNKLKNVDINRCPYFFHILWKKKF